MPMDYIGFLCGGFYLAEGRGACASKLDGCWQGVELGAAEITDYEYYYFPDFVRFSFKPDAGENVSMQRFRLNLDRDLEIALSHHIEERRIALRLVCADLYLMPFRHALFSIRVELSGVDADDITLIMSKLRNLKLLSEAFLKEFRQLAVDPLTVVWRSLSAAAAKGKDFDYMDLVEDGNKLSLFSIAKIKSGSGITDELLFELGTLAPIGSCASSGFNAPSEQYLGRIMVENSLSVYKNWKALCLADTVTILSLDCPDWLENNWCDDYFGLIYIWQLFRRNYLFRLTNRFRYERENVQALKKESVEFERNCSFQTISYNFLPIEFSACVVHGLGIDGKKEELYHMISQEQIKDEQLADKRMNNLLFFMTCLTMASAIYDTCCLFGQLLPYYSVVLGYRTVGAIMLSIVLVAMLIYRIRTRK